MPKVSVIIPVYNVEKYLKECLDSVINQTLQDIEIICIDDGSTDNSLNILKEYAQKDKRLIYKSQENNGAGSARNFGLRIASGEFLYFLDGDDYIELSLLEKMYNKAKSNKADICLCKEQKLDNQTREIIDCSWSLKTEFLNKEFFSLQTNAKNLLQITVPNVFIKLFKRAFVIEKELKFQEIKTCNDVYFSYASLCLAKRITYLDETLATYRVNIDNCLTKRRGKSSGCIILAYKALRQKLRKNRIFKKASHTFYNAAIRNFSFELSHNNELQKQQMLYIYKDFLPNRYFKKLLKLAKIEYNLDTPKSKFNINDIFSIQKEKYRKILHLLGFKLSFKRTKKIKKDEFLMFQQKPDGVFEYSEFKNNNVRENSVLLVEANDCHSEVLIGISKYFLDLGFNVDAIISQKEAMINPFARIQDNKLRVFEMSPFGIKYLLQSSLMKQYKYLYLNSDILYYYDMSYQKFFSKINLPSKRILQMCHRLENFEENCKTNYNYLKLADMPVVSSNPASIVNPHYYGEINVTPKNDITNFIIVGNLEKGRRNFNLLINALLYLTKSNITNFKITVVCRNGNIKHFPKQLRRFIDFKGSLNYPDMFNEIEKADFFLPLLDPENPDHDRYLTTGTSGSFQIIYGFRLPCIINEKFAKLHYFNTGNSLIYNKNNELGETLEKAIQMNQTEYSKLQTNLETVSKNLTELSINNLKEIL